MDTPATLSNQQLVKARPRLQLTPFWQRTSTKLYLRLAIILGALALAAVGGAAIGYTGLGFWIVGGIAGVGVAALIAMRPEHGIYILVTFIFANLSVVLEDAFGIPDSNKVLVALIFVGILAKRVVIENKPLIFRLTEISILITGIVLVMSIFISDYKWDMQYLSIEWAKDFLILLILVQVSVSERVFKNAQWALIVTATALAALSAYQSVTGDYTNTFYGLAKSNVQQILTGVEDSERITGPIDDPNFYGLILVSILPMAVYRMLTTKQMTKRLITGIFALIILTTIFFTYSRGALLALGVVGALIVIERRMNVYKVAAIGVVIAIIVFPLLPQAFWDRMGTLGGIVPSSGDVSQQNEVSFRGRTSQLMVAVDMFRDHPFLGVGKGNYSHNYLDYSERIGLDGRLEERQAHSLYLEIAAEQGVIGLMAFGLMMFFVYRSSFTARRQAKEIEREDLIPWIAAAQIGLVGYLVGSIFLHGDYARYMWLLIGFNAASSIMTMTLLRNEQHKRRRQEMLRNDTPSIAAGVD